MSSHPAATPHGPLTRVADGVHAVQGTFKMGPGVRISRTMTVLESGDGLVILNAVRLSDEEQARLDALGPVKHLVKLSDSHSIDEPYYADHYSPEIWALPGASPKGYSATRTLSGEGPVSGGKVVDFTGAGGWRECALHVPLGGGTLMTCDSVQNCVPDPERESFFGGVVTRLMGFKGGVIVPSMWRKYQKVPTPRDVMSGVLELSFANLVCGHGPPVVGGADAMVRSAIEA